MRPSSFPLLLMFPPISLPSFPLTGNCSKMLLVEDGKVDWFCWDDNLGYIGFGGGDGSNCCRSSLFLKLL